MLHACCFHRNANSKAGLLLLLMGPEHDGRREGGFRDFICFPFLRCNGACSHLSKSPDGTGCSTMAQVPTCRVEIEIERADRGEDPIHTPAAARLLRNPRVIYTGPCKNCRISPGCNCRPIYSNRVPSSQATPSLTKGPHILKNPTCPRKKTAGQTHCPGACALHACAGGHTSAL